MKVKVQVYRQGIIVNSTSVNISDEDFARVSPDTRHWLLLGMSTHIRQEMDCIKWDGALDALSVSDIIKQNHEPHDNKWREGK